MSDSLGSLNDELIRTSNSLLETEGELQGLIMAIKQDNDPNMSVYVAKYQGTLEELQNVIVDIRSMI